MQIQTGSKHVASKSGTILFVDSVPEIRQNFERLLAQSSYAVETCTNGEEALTILSASPKNFRLAVLDLVTLAGSIQKLLTRIRRMNPSLPLIVSPGKRLPIPAEELYRLGVVALLPKPYDYGMLQRIVNAVLA